MKPNFLVILSIALLFTQSIASIAKGESNRFSESSLNNESKVITFHNLKPVDVVPWYYDGDKDGYGDPNVFLVDSIAPAGYVINNLDCDDGNALVNPDGKEVCNGLDDDCSGTNDDNIVAEISLDWQKAYGGTGADQALSIEPTLDGGFIVAGKTSSSNGNVTSNHGKSDA